MVYDEINNILKAGVYSLLLFAHALSVQIPHAVTYLPIYIYAIRRHIAMGID